ncbi:MAG: glycine--tRNA ligase subunit beta [Oscillatoria sp. PMC 1068.18]|nr:glycine--tRNA ligase subunit beta [Oscillatoria sp. PMC 1076.18]MEC4987412.1 glycine--tRNA ligase subunit beta [Oscillatoria sp. PMC 1068.18]
MPAFLLEVGTEELPADFVASAIAQWENFLPQSLDSAFLTPERINVYGTPRRLAVVLQGLPSQQPDREEEIKGPPAQVAFKNNQPTKAAIGFARKQEVELTNLEVRETEKGAFVFVQKKIPGRTAKEIFSELIPEWIAKLEGRRFMRWGDGDLRFPRPIRWLVALIDEEILPVELINGSTTVVSDRQSWGHRVLHPEAIQIPHASQYVETLQTAYIEVDPKVRSQKIQQQTKTEAENIQGIADIYPDLLAEVINLVEYPTAVVGKFDAEFLSLPTEVITTVMVSHQRYFPIKETNDPKSKLLPNFITISNGDPNKGEVIAAGNARVIRARLADAQFFYKADLAKPLEMYVPQLEKITFQEDLGSVLAKVERIKKIALNLAKELNLSQEKCEQVSRTALLCKADLVSQMVYEFPELQGIMGQKYALASQEAEVVANGIFDHYLPRGADDILPETFTGQIVGISDRLDTLVSIFGLGMLPTGSSDPFALRRAANAIINLTWNSELKYNLYQNLQQVAADFVLEHPDQENPLAKLQEFFLQRLRTLLQDDLKIDYDLVNAVLGEDDPEYTERALEDLLDLRSRALFLQKIRNNGKMEAIYETVNRSARLAVKGNLDTKQLEPKQVVKPELFEQSSEQAFYNALVALVPNTQASQAERNYQLLVDELAKIAPTVSRFFDGEDSVLVMAEDPQVQENRLNLLGLLRNHARVLADFGAIVK